MTVSTAFLSMKKKPPELSLVDRAAVFSFHFKLIWFRDRVSLFSSVMLLSQSLEF